MAALRMTQIQGVHRGICSCVNEGDPQGSGMDLGESACVYLWIFSERKHLEVLLRCLDGLSGFCGEVNKYRPYSLAVMQWAVKTKVQVLRLEW